MTGITDGGVDLPERFHEAQMDVVQRRGVGALAVQQHIRNCANVEEFCSRADLLSGAHSGRDDQRLSGGSELC